MQARIYAGYAKGALKLGTDYGIYRPIAATNPLTSLIVTQKAALIAKDLSWMKVNKHGEMVWLCITDGRQTLTGDYLSSATEKFFIASQLLNQPILCIKCNRTVRLMRMPVSATIGAVAYQGECAASMQDILGAAGANGAFGTGWPASILLKGRAESTGSGLPGATRNVGWEVLLPSSIGVTIQESDVLIDDLGRKYSIQAAEQSDLGWRLVTVEEHP